MHTWGVVRGNAMCTWLCRKGEHKVVRKALNSSSTYKNQFLQRSKQFGPKLR